MSSDAEEGDGTGRQIDESQLDAILQDPQTKAFLLKKMGLEEQEYERQDQRSAPSQASGTNPSGWPPYPPPFWPGLFPPFPIGTAASKQPMPTWMGGRGAQGQWEDGPGPSSSASESGSSAKRSREEEMEEDVIDLLEDSEALELVEFDPRVKPTDTWEPPQSIKAFLGKHFNKALTEEEREAIIKDFPRPSAEAVATPRLGGEVKDQLKSKGKDPHHGAEKSLYKIQDQLLDVVGPLTCLWADLLNKEANVSPQDILLLLQRALVLLGSTSHSISVEQRKVAWAKMNPKLRNLGTEDYGERGSDLFGPGFLEKASKRLEVEKTLAKVAKAGQPPNAKKGRYEHDRSDLRSFLSKGASARCGNTKDRPFQPHTSYNRFNRGRQYFRQGDSSQKFLKGTKKPHKDKPHDQ